jgi:hypothetical protein
MSNKTHKVGSLNTIGEQRGNYYTQDYFIDNSDKSTYEGALIFQGDAHTSSPYDFPDGAYFYKWQFVPYADHWALKVEAAEEGWFDDLGMKTVETEHGLYYEQSFYFSTEDRADYETPLVYFEDANVTPYTFPANSYFKEWVFTSLGENTKLWVKAAQLGYFEEDKKKGERRGFIHSKSIPIFTTDKERYELPLIYHGNANILPYTFDPGLFFYEWEWEKEGDHYVLHVQAANGEFFEEARGGGSTVKNDVKYVKTWYDIGEREFWKPEGWGARKATAQEAGYVYSENGVWSRPNTPLKRAKDNSDADIGDWIYRDADTTDKGEADFDNCPFEYNNGSEIVACTDTVLKPDLIGQDFFCQRYNVSYLVTSAGFLDSATANFMGKNGAMPSEYEPSVFLSGMWFAMEQNIESYAKSSKSGVWYHRITRGMKRVPLVQYLTGSPVSYQLTWKTTQTWGW